MDSPNKIKKLDTTPVRKNGTHTTPKNSHSRKKLHNGLNLYGLYRESSPEGIGFSHSSDLEIGWGDSPEHKVLLSSTPVRHKPDLKDSPRSSSNVHKRLRSSFKMPSKPSVNIAKYVSELQELSKNLIKEGCIQLNSSDSSNKDSNMGKSVDSPGVSKFLKEDDELSECLIECTQSVERKATSRMNWSHSHNFAKGRDTSFEKVVQDFLNESDDWVLEMGAADYLKTPPRKGPFVKSRSENQLVSPVTCSLTPKRKVGFVKSRSDNHLKQPCSTSNAKSLYFVKSESSGLRRTNSFGSNTTTNLPETTHPLQKQNSFTETNERAPAVSQYTLEDIERKRLEAKYRREKETIEKRKMEALKKLESKSLKPWKASYNQT